MRFVVKDPPNHLNIGELAVCTHDTGTFKTMGTVMDYVEKPMVLLHVDGLQDFWWPAELCAVVQAEPDAAADAVEE